MRRNVSYGLRRLNGALDWKGTTDENHLLWSQLVPALHSSSLPDGTYGGNPSGFVVETSDGNFYYSGDTALTMDLRLIGESTLLAFAALCVGDNFTMGIDDAIKAAEFIRCNKVVGVH